MDSVPSGVGMETEPTDEAADFEALIFAVNATNCLCRLNFVSYRQPNAYLLNSFFQFFWKQKKHIFFTKL